MKIPTYAAGAMALMGLLSPPDAHAYCHNGIGEKCFDSGKCGYSNVGASTECTGTSSCPIVGPDETPGPCESECHESGEACY